MHTLGRDRAWIYAHPEFELDAAEAEKYFELVARRASGARSSSVLPTMPSSSGSPPRSDSFATPLGEVEVDRIAIEMTRRFPQLLVSDEPHEQEASLEVQLQTAPTVSSWARSR